MKISIITPAYNAGKTINRCLTSVVNQTYNNIEVIIVNDGSTDDTLSVSKELALKDKRIQIINQKNMGIYLSRRTGISSCTGDAIFFIDADDYLELNAIELLVRKMVETEANLVIGNHFHHENGGKKKVENKIPTEQSKLNILKYLLLGEIKGYIWGRLIKRHLLDDINYTKGYALTDDILTNFTIVCKHHCKVAFVEQPLYNYIIHSSNITLSGNSKYVDSRYDHLEIVEQMLNETKLIGQLQNELSAFKCRAWIDYCRKGGKLAKDKDFYAGFYNHHYPPAKKLIPFYQRIEMLAYKKNHKIGQFSTKSMKWVKSKLSI